MLYRGRLEEVKREVRGQYPAYAVAGGSASQGDLPIYDDLAPALQRRDHDIDAVGGPKKARGVGDVSLDELGTALHERIEPRTFARVGERRRADEQSQGDILGFEEIVGYVRADRPGGPGEQYSV